MPEPPRFIRFLVKGSVLISMFIAGCAAVPVNEFSAYRESFDQARRAGEQVLIDYAAAKKEVESLEINKPAEVPSVRAVQFDAEELASRGDAVDAVAVRLRAWEVVAAYNEALLALVEGRPAAQVEAATRNLVDSMANFPVNAFQDLAARVTPVLGVLSTALTELQKAYDRQKALDAMAAVGPVISDGFIRLLIKDSELFYNLRFGLNDRKFRKTIRRIIALRKGFKRLAETAQPGDDITKMVKAINDKLATLPRKSNNRPQVSALKLERSGGADGEVVRSQLVDLRDNIFKLTDTALTQTRELSAYRDMLVAYVRMVGELDARLRALSRAADSGEATLPQSAELLYSIIRVRQSYLTYRENKQ